MTPKERAAMQQALEALERWRDWDDWNNTAAWGLDNENAITTLQEALDEPDMNLSCKSVQARLATSWGYMKAEQAEQEPVAWIEIERGIPLFVKFADKYKPDCDGFIPLYAEAIREKIIK